MHRRLLGLALCQCVVHVPPSTLHVLGSAIRWWRRRCALPGTSARLTPPTQQQPLARSHGQGCIDVDGLRLAVFTNAHVLAPAAKAAITLKLVRRDVTLVFLRCRMALIRSVVHSCTPTKREAVLQVPGHIVHVCTPGRDCTDSRQKGRPCWAASAEAPIGRSELYGCAPAKRETALGCGCWGTEQQIYPVLYGCTPVNRGPHWAAQVPGHRSADLLCAVVTMSGSASVSGWFGIGLSPADPVDPRFHLGNLSSLPSPRASPRSGASSSQDCTTKAVCSANGLAAIGACRVNDHSVVCSAIPTPLWRELAREAAVHVFVDGDAVVEVTGATLFVRCAGAHWSPLSQSHVTWRPSSSPAPRAGWCTVRLPFKTKVSKSTGGSVCSHCDCDTWRLPTNMSALCFLNWSDRRLNWCPM